MKSISFLIGGRAGDGIDTASVVLARLFSRVGYRVYVYRDYPSIIRGGHTFSVIRISRDKPAASVFPVDFLLALNQETFDLHQARLAKNGIILYNSDVVRIPAPSESALGIPLETIIKEEKAAPIMRNAGMIGALVRSLDIPRETLEDIFRKDTARDSAQNSAAAVRGYQASKPLRPIEVLSQECLPLLTGNEAIGLGLVKGGLSAYIAYPMTPVSGLLHFLASMEEEFSLKVIHPENEISVMMMAMGFSYMGERVAVGSSGGGFCLMTEGLSFSAMSELPVVVVLGQRTGPSTGLPTYTAQTELNFALYAGHGEFTRLVVAPGDAEDAYYWSARSLQLAQRYQIPVFILVDKTVCEGVFSFDRAAAGGLPEEKPFLWDGRHPYRRYADTGDGVSPLAVAPIKGSVVKVNSYEHDEAGITTEDPLVTQKMQDKRLRKGVYLREALGHDPVVIVGGSSGASCAILSWGSNKGVCAEAAGILGVKHIHISVLMPFPRDTLTGALAGVTRIICVEHNATGQLAGLLAQYKIEVSEKVLKYDGRPFTVEELTERVRRVMQ